MAKKFMRDTQIDAAADAVYGMDGVDAGRRVAELVSIMDIRPDPVQPRRIVPKAVRRHWKGTPDTAGYMLDKWLEMSESRLGRVIPIRFILTRQGFSYLSELEDENDPVVVKFFSVAKLALDIYDKGRLLSPISVYHTRDGLMINHGERRWWAFHLLYHLFGAVWDSIPAEINDPDVWAQASENAQREELTAIGKARQFAILLMDLHEKSNTGRRSFLTYDQIVAQGDSDRDYYAQVADGNEYRIPRGTSDSLLVALGEKSPARLREIRSLLRVDDDIWVTADEEGWALGAVLAHVRPEKDPDGESGLYRPNSDGMGNETPETTQWGDGYVNDDGDYQPSFNEAGGIPQDGIGRTSPTTPDGLSRFRDAPVGSNNLVSVGEPESGEDGPPQVEPDAVQSQKYDEDRPPVWEQREWAETPEWARGLTEGDVRVILEIYNRCMLPLMQIMDVKPVPSLAKLPPDMQAEMVRGIEAGILRLFDWWDDVARVLDVDANAAWNGVGELLTRAEKSHRLYRRYSLPDDWSE